MCLSVIQPELFRLRSIEVSWHTGSALHNVPFCRYHCKHYSIFCGLRSPLYYDWESQEEKSSEGRNFGLTHTG